MRALPITPTARARKEGIMADKMYTITCSEEQLRLIANAVEDWHRFLAGQCEMANATSMTDNYHELYDILTKQVEPLVASYGWDGGTCPNKFQRKAIAMSYGIYRQILHFFAMQRKDNEWDVYKSPTLTCDEQGGLIKIEQIKK